MKAKATSFVNKLNSLELIKDPVFVGRVMASILMLGLALGYTLPVLAQGEDLGAVITQVVETITGIIRSASIGLGVLGLVMWGLAKLVRPYMPELSQKVNNYIPDLMMALLVIAFANQIVSSLASAFGSGGE